jgi:solute carrier family 30 (zinc transporter), member 9
MLYHSRHAGRAVLRRALQLESQRQQQHPLMCQLLKRKTYPAVVERWFGDGSCSTTTTSTSSTTTSTILPRTDVMPGGAFGSAFHQNKQQQQQQQQQQPKWHTLEPVSFSSWNASSSLSSSDSSNESSRHSRKKRGFSSVALAQQQQQRKQLELQHRRRMAALKLAMNLLLEEHRRQFSTTDQKDNDSNNAETTKATFKDETISETTMASASSNTTTNTTTTDPTTDGKNAPPPKKMERPPRMSVPNFGLGPDAHQAIRSLQQARKERAHAKTASNVQRALMGNVIICVAKLGAWLSSGSSSMMSEFVHSVVDCGNQSLLLMGLRDSRNQADRLHPYGYGKSVYFWALVSALGTFFLGAGVSMSHAVGEIMHPSLTSITTEVWAVLGLSFAIDGWVLQKTIAEILESKPKHVSFYEHLKTLRDPATLAVLLEDGAACLGILFAIGGISASHFAGMPIFDGMAGVGISCLLGMVGLALVRVNHRFLLGQGVDREMIDDIEKVILSRRSIDNVYSMQSQWTGPETFSFKAEVDFDGTYLAAQLMPRYQEEFRRAHEELDSELEVLLCWYAEDVIRAVEREVRHIEAKIRQKYPGAEYIELEPMSKDADKFAIDDSFEKKLQLIEKEEMQSFIRVLYQNQRHSEGVVGITTEESMASTDTQTSVDAEENGEKKL